MSQDEIRQVVQAAGRVKWLARPVWALVMGALGFAYWFGTFQTEYRRNAEEGTPALRRLIDEQRRLASEQREWNQGQAVTNATLKQIVVEHERRLTRVEDRK